MSDSFHFDHTVPDLSGQIEPTTELIGRGGYGSVYKGRWLVGSAANATPATIAIKIIDLVPLRDEAQRTKRFKQIKRELSLWCSIQHENILQLLGIIRINGDTNIPAFVCPWMENGNAKEFCSRNPQFPPITILYDIINGLHYLHTSQPEIVHGDIKAVNVLINNRCEACLCDFGLSRFLTDDTLWKTTATQAGGTVRWMAPELLDGDTPTPTKESDIYAYAMTCYEILSGDVPFKSVSNVIAISIKIMKGERPNRTETFHSDSIWDIITRCWEQEPKDRPPTEIVLGVIQKARMATNKGNPCTGTEWQSLVIQKARMATNQRNPYTGIKQSLVIGIDVGTTLSGVSYTLLEPGKVPRIQPVTRFSGQRGKSKVPSVVCYDQDGHVIAVGPETDPEVSPILSKIEGVRRVEWFTLRLLPPHLAADKRARLEEIWSLQEPPEEIEGIGREIVEPEPPNKTKPRLVTGNFKTVVQVFADFLQYLFRSAKEYIIETERYIDPTFTWSLIEKNSYFVLTHPNGWEGKQQSQMREAAVAAGLVHTSEASERINFVTEGEASLHSCLEMNPELHQKSGGLLVVKCGGGTIDLSAYTQTDKGGYKEIVSPDCLLQGSIFVTSRARDYFKGKFKDSQFGADDDVEAMARAFDEAQGAKCTFEKPTTPYFVRFGGLRDNDQKYGITDGKFKVEGTQVAKFFEPAVEDIIGGIRNQCKNTKDGVSINYILLVGGFGKSGYLYARLRDYFKSSGIVVLRPDNVHLDKAVADGSVSWYLDRYVSTRVARYSYGVMTRHLFDDKDPDHLDRKIMKETQANGKSYIPGVFGIILKKDSEVSEETLFRQPHKFILTRRQFAAWTTVSSRLKCYRGKAADPPKWVDREPNSFHETCTIQANISHIKQNMKLRRNKAGKLFYRLDLEIVVLLGFTELKAYVTWKEGGVEKRTDASIIYD